jgi:signal transduction histidine kinase
VDTRLPIGEKGIGRLAAGRLGERLDVWTRKDKREEWLHIPFNWRDFDDMNTPLDEVLVVPDYDTPPPTDWPDSGTILEIRELSVNWAGRVPGRKIAGRQTNRVGRLRQDLELVTSPLAATEQDFHIELRSDLKDHDEFVGLIGAADMRLLDYRYDFTVSWDEDRGVKVHTRVQRAADFADELGRKTVSSETKYYGPKSDPEADPTVHPGTLEGGPFRGTMYYAARKGTARRMTELGIPAGVHVYRDGIRVEPYGDPEDDWLGVQARKASRQGYAAIRPHNLYGFVLISKLTNRELVDMTNRQGLVENQAYEEFVAHVRAEFRRFADVVSEEFVKPGWAKDEDRAQALAERAIPDRGVLIRDIVHNLRQPVSSLATEMENLRYVVENFPMPDETKDQLNAIRQRAAGHLADISEVVRAALEDPPVSEIEPVSLYDVVTEAVASVRGMADTYDSQLDVDVGDRVVLAPKEYLRRAVSELLRNGIQAPRVDGTARVVQVRATGREGSIVLQVSDNGVGVRADIAAQLFERPISLEGRQGLGLVSVRDLLATFGARAELVNPGEPGATFEVIIPSVGEVRRLLRG